MVASDFVQRVRLHEDDDLVIGEGEHVRGSGRIFQIASLRVVLTDHTVLKLPGVLGMPGGESLAKLLQQLLIGLGAPDLQADRLTCGLFSGGGGFVLRGLLFTLLRLRRLRTAGTEAGNQHKGKK